MRIPSTASAEVMQAFREVWASLEPWIGGKHIDLKGRRISNAGNAVADQDYLTLGAARALITGPLAAISPSSGTQTDRALYGTHAQRIARAPTPEGTLFIETDRTHTMYQAQLVSGALAWVWVGGGPYRQSSIASAPTGLGVNDTGFLFHSTAFSRTWRWTGSAWDDAPGEDARFMIAYFTVAPDYNGWQLCDGSSVTRSTEACGTTAVTVPNLTGSNRFLRSATVVGGTGGAATTHTHEVNPPNTRSTVDIPLAGQDVQSGAGVTVAAHPHDHDVDIGGFASGGPSGAGGTDALPPFYDALPYFRL